jgi:hypothetical protein
MGSSVIAKVCPHSRNEAINAMAFYQDCESHTTKKEQRSHLQSQPKRFLSWAFFTVGKITKLCSKTTLTTACLTEMPYTVTPTHIPDLLIVESSLAD